MRQAARRVQVLEQQRADAGSRPPAAWREQVITCEQALEVADILAEIGVLAEVIAEVIANYEQTTSATAANA